MGWRDVEEFLREVKRETGGLPRDLHVTRMFCALIAVSDGRVIKVQEPRLHYCPYYKRLYDLGCMDTRELVLKEVERKIYELGYFTARREVCRTDVAVPFGASEMMMYALKRGEIEVAVIVCDGAGTVITGNPSLVQGIGAHMNGLFYTSPIREVIDKIRLAGGCVLFPESAKINQLEGLRKAVEMGCRRIAVTINGFAGEPLREVRRVEREADVSVVSLVVCTTGVERERAEEAAEHADIVWGCASKHVREVVGGKARLQLGVRIPVFVLTQKGLGFVASYSSEGFKDRIEGGKRYLVMLHPREPDKCVRLTMGAFTSYLQEVDGLLVESEDAPRPLL
ncbi:MAG: DUF2099 family protein [Candidatus Bathyarchaeia archaeon]